MPYASVRKDLALYYEVKGEGLPIVFIHPFVMGKNIFMHQGPLAKKYKIIRYDLAGHGESTRGSEAVTIRLLAEDLKNLLDQLEIDQAAVCGYSHGGLVAQEFALLYPDRTVALILSGGYPKLTTITPKFFIKSVMLMAKARMIPLAAKLQAKLNKYFSEDEKDIYDYARKADAKRVYEYCKAGLEYDSTPALKRLTMPVLLLYGSLEKPMHRYGIPFEKQAPNTKVMFIDKGTHQLPSRSFSAFNRALDDFLQEIEKSRAPQ
ncbi:alpha/beta fold hydrolase [Jeotgalibacillus proteolyticus]|uniref:Hydrolase n=1 Tax=Jeotgalibacillus proteolyticus TaxID=2082395 RepID=A0A2S5GE43_9BACL|nr:alpha/beta hydrolase [Jeotgalibacillus proteolyticus]PPA71174.1 hydrolase [Jeotgalibacillus proteolyticus]